jgi:hypothetical protein
MTDLVTRKRCVQKRGWVERGAEVWSHVRIKSSYFGRPNHSR